MDAVVVLSAKWLAAPIGMLVVMAGCAALLHRRSRRLGLSSYCWAVACAAVLAVLAVWCARGLCECTRPAYVLCAVAWGAAGCVALAREQLTAALDGPVRRGAVLPRRGQALSIPRGSHEAAVDRPQAATAPLKLAHPARAVVRNAVALAAASVAAFFALELADNPDVGQIPPECVAVSIALIALLVTCAYFAGQRHGGAAAVPVALVGVLGLVSNFLDRFKNTALMPSDLLAWQTALSVSGGYTYTFDDGILASLSCSALALAACFLACPARTGTRAAWRRQERLASAHGQAAPRRGRVRAAAANVACAVLAAAVFAGAVTPSYRDAFGYSLWYWNLRVSYHEHGFVPGFVQAAQDLVITVPDGWSEERADDLMSYYKSLYEPDADAAQAAAAFDAQRPSVVVVMNETYADMSIYENLHAGYEGPFAAHAQGALAGGPLTVSVNGGNTCNTEFEFLTGGSMGFLGYAKYPFLQYGFEQIDTLPKQFAALGYGTLAMHPNLATNWNREVVYEQMGFDEALFIDRFEGAERWHNAVSDAATYDVILERLRTAEEPLFVFDVTMQNHSPYDQGGIPEADLVHVETDLDAYVPAAEIDEYQSCIAKSDESLQAFLAQLAELDRPVVVVFFGDHQPFMSRDFNEALFPGEPQLESQARLMQTCWFAWANFDLPAETAKHPTSANYLGAVVKEAIGAPLTGYQQAQLALAADLPLVNANGYADADGTWHAFGEGPGADEAADFDVIHYAQVAGRL